MSDFGCSISEFLIGGFFDFEALDRKRIILDSINGDPEIEIKSKFETKTMDKIELKRRTQRFAIDVIKFCETLPFKPSLNVLSNQLLRCSTSVGANYRSACRGKSAADFINKIVIVEE
jgi:hypothetical protein